MTMGKFRPAFWLARKQSYQQHSRRNPISLWAIRCRPAEPGRRGRGALMHRAAAKLAIPLEKQPSQCLSLRMQRMQFLGCVLGAGV